MDERRFREAEQRLWESVDVAPTERWLHLDRAKCSVRVQEVGAGPAVVFVHGGSNGGSSWASLVARFDGFRWWAAAHPDRIDRIVEFSWTIGAPMAKVPLVMRLGSVGGVGWLMARVPPTERTVRMLLRQIGLGAAVESGRFDQASLDWYVALLRDTHTMRNEFAASPKLVSPVHGLNEQVLLPARLLADITSSVYFLWGADDPNGGADIARQFVGLLPNAELELMAGAGHAPWIDDPDHAAAVTHAFLERSS